MYVLTWIATDDIASIKNNNKLLPLYKEDYSCNKINIFKYYLNLLAPVDS